MRLISCLLDLVRESCDATFVQKRTCTRASELILGTLCSFGRRTVSRAICALGRQHQDWSADYKLYSRSPWQAERLSDPVLREYLKRYREGPICAAMDDTKLARTGRRIQTAFWQRDPLSPPFHVNLVYGLRFMQSCLVFPHYHEGNFAPRAIPVRFTECPVVKKPGKRATSQQLEDYREARKKQNLSLQGLAIMCGLRQRLDELGATPRVLLEAVDGSLCNRTLFRKPIGGVELIGRARKDARLCFAAASGSRRKYAIEHFTPESVRLDPRIPWRKTRIYYGGAWRSIRYREIKDVLWRRGSATRPLRLFVIASIPYRTSPHAKTNYRQPAYLLTTATQLGANVLLQAYFDRWQIEVNSRDEKDTLGVGQAQVWSAKSVPRQPAFAVAAYSLLLLAGLKSFGPGRTNQYVPLPKWRKNAKRPSALDLVTLLRKEINETSVSSQTQLRMAQNLVKYAYT